MDNKLTHWTSDEFLAYTLLYTANADYIFDKEEQKLILSKVNSNAYGKVSKELEHDNDYQSLQKILSYTQQHKYDNKDIDLLLHEIELLFMCDGKYDILEKNMMMNLTKLLKHQANSIVLN